MRVCWPKLIRMFLFVCLSGCKGMHFRPASVPSSAVWVDSTFIDCSVEKQANANRCTVYKDDSGEILADGLFVLSTSHTAADSTALHYSAFGNRVIYLADARRLVPSVLGERDPTHRLITNKLRDFAAHGAGQVTNCRESTTDSKTDELSECGNRAFAERKPFYVRYYRTIEGGSRSYGLAGDADGNVVEVAYDSKGWLKIGLPKRAQLFDENRLVVIHCPKPVALIKTENGELACALPVATEESPGTVQQKPVETTVCEIAENPSAFNNKLVRVRGHVSVNFEYSTIEGDGCSDAIWFAYGDDSGPTGLVATVMGGARPGAEDADGKLIPPVRVKLIRNSNFSKFQRMMAAAVKADDLAMKSRKDELVTHRVTATFVGRVDGVSPEIHAYHLKRSPLDKADYLGFGQTGLFDAQLVVKSVENDAVRDTVRVRLDSPNPK
jgi:hypothetical protein